MLAHEILTSSKNLTKKQLLLHNLSPTVTVEAIPPSSSQQDISSESTDQDDPTFDPQQELDENPSLKMEQFLEDWVVSLSREDKISLGLFLSYNLRNVLNFTATRAAEYAVVMMGKSDRTIRQWHSDFVEHSEIPDNNKVFFWSSETLNKKVTRYIRENCNDTMWAGKPQKMTFALGVPKGMKQVLEERGINTITLKADQMRQILAAHDDFKNEKPRLMEGKGQTALYLPKFHQELNPIERVW